MNELNYEGLPVFSKMFLSIIKSIKQKSKNPILDYILSKSQRDFSPKIRLVTLADHMLIDITDEEKEKLKNLDYLILNCIRREELHPGHFILPQILELNEELKPKQLFLTHISHHLGLHDETEKELPENVHIAYDGLELIF